MASIVYTNKAIHDLNRLAEFLGPLDPAAARETGPLIMGAIGALAAHPLLGARAAGEARELIVSRGRTGYVALYSYNPVENEVVIHAIRHQRETGFDED